MQHDILTHPTRFFEDESLVLVAFGGFGCQVLHLLRQEFGRIDVPKDRVYYLGFDTDSSQSNGFQSLLEPGSFQAVPGTPGAQGRTLQKSIAHLPESSLREIEHGCTSLPAIGFAVFHRDDELLVTSRARAVLDEARARNPTGRIKCILVGGMGGGTSNGMAVPFLFRIGDHLKHKNVQLEVFLATSEGHAEPDHASREDLQRNCVASAMLWEQVMLGERDFHYPGKDGVREERTFRGPLQHRTYVFSGGAGHTKFQYPVIASIIAHCIATLETTGLGTQLEAQRVGYMEEILERVWDGPNGGRHPTSLAAMNVAGLKADCFPALFHMRAVRAFIDDVSRSLPAATEGRIQASAETCLREARLTDGLILEDLEIGANPLTREEIASAKVPQEKLHTFLQDRLEEDVGTLIELADGRRDAQPADVLIDRARLAISAKASAWASGPEGHLPGAVLFYQAIQKRIEQKREAMLERDALTRRELGTTPHRDRLEVLLDRLRADTAPVEGQRLGVAERFGATLTVSVPTQVRKILEVAAEIRKHAQLMAGATVLDSVYERLAHFCEKQREELQGRLYTLNNVASICMREEEAIARSARSAFTYQRQRFEPLIDHLWETLRGRVELPPTSEVIQHLGRDLPAFLGTERKVLDRLLEAVRPDADQLAEATDALLATDTLVGDALKESLAQFFPTVQVDRDRFPNLETARRRFVVCTKRMYQAHRHEIFEGYEHVESKNPYNVLFTDHEEGFHFAALTYMQAIQETYKKLDQEGKAALGHPTAELARELVPLDD